MLGLIDGVLHAFKPEEGVLAAGVPGTIARGKDRGIACPGTIVDDDAVIDGKARILRKLGIRNHADTDQRDIGGPGFATGDNTFEHIFAHELLDDGVEVDLHACRTMNVFIESGNKRGNGALHQAVERFEHRYVEAMFHRDGCDFQPDITTTDDGKALAGLKDGAQRIDIGDAAQIVDSLEIRVGYKNGAHARSGGEQQLVVSDHAAIGQHDLLLCAIDAGSGCAEDHFDLGLGVEGLRLQEQALALKLALQIRLGERRALIGQERLIADHCDRACEAFGPEGRDRLCAGLACANDDNPF